MGAKNELTTSAIRRKESRVLSVIDEDEDLQLLQTKTKPHETEKNTLTNTLTDKENNPEKTGTTETEATVTWELSTPGKTATPRKRKVSLFGANEEDLRRLKETANRLKLNTRRESVITWREKYLNSQNPTLDHARPLTSLPAESRLMTNERRDRINESLAWIRTQLVDMRRMDQSLAKQFLSIRHQLSRLRLQRSCEEHEDMLDGATYDMEDFRKLSKVLDEPLESYAPSPLKHIGVTKMNICSRRFSTS